MNIIAGLQQLVKFNLLFHEFMHGIVAVPFVYLIWKKTKSKKRVVLTILTTFLIDLDHLFDYFLYYGLESNFNWSYFIQGKHFEATQVAYMPLHGWEWVILLAVLTKVKGWDSVYAAIFSGLLPHLIFDSFIQNHILFYSIIYRASVSGFSYLW